MQNIDRELERWLVDIACGLLDDPDCEGVSARVVVNGGDRLDEDRLILVAGDRARRLLIGPRGKTADALRRLTRIKRHQLGRERAIDLRIDPPGQADGTPRVRRRVVTAR